MHSCVTSVCVCAHVRVHVYAYMCVCTSMLRACVYMCSVHVCLCSVYRPLCVCVCFDFSTRVLLQCWTQRGESLAKTETAVSFSKQGFLDSTDIQFYETGQNKAVRSLAAGHSTGDLNMTTVVSVTRVSVQHQQP